jgi:hypothetical protein
MFELELDGTWLKSIGPLNASSSFLSKEVKSLCDFPSRYVLQCCI